MEAFKELLAPICAQVLDVDCETLERVLSLAIELSVEGREGKKVGTMFIVGDSQHVLERSRCLILDPLRGHPEERRRLDDVDVRETVKELAQLDGAFVISDEGVVLSASRYVDVPAQDLEVPLGLGSRHYAAASVTKQTQAIAVVLSRSSVVRVFDDGALIAEIMPKRWFLCDYTNHLSPPYSERSEYDLTVLSK